MEYKCNLNMGLNLKDHNLQDMGIGKLKANVQIFDTIYERYLWIWMAQVLQSIPETLH